MNNIFDPGVVPISQPTVPFRTVDVVGVQDISSQVLYCSKVFVVENRSKN